MEVWAEQALQLPEKWSASEWKSGQPEPVDKPDALQSDLESDAPLHECDCQQIFHRTLDSWNFRNGQSEYAVIREEVRIYHQKENGDMYLFHKRVDTLILDYRTGTLTVVEFKRR